MTLSKENPASLNQLEELVSFSSEPNSEPVPQLEGLVDLLMELMFGTVTEEPANDTDNRARAIAELSKLLLPPQTLEVLEGQPQLSGQQEHLVKISEDWPKHRTIGRSPESPEQAQQSLNPDLDDIDTPLNGLINLLLSPQQREASAAESDKNEQARFDGNTLSVSPELDRPNQQINYPNLEIKGLDSPPESTLEIKDLGADASLEVEALDSQPESTLETKDLGDRLALQQPLLNGQQTPESLPSKQDSDDLDDPLERLQTLMFGSVLSDIEKFKTGLLESQLPEVHHLIATIEHKVGTIDRQIYDPEELKKLLLPWIGEILSMKIAESKQEMVEAFVPIVDAAIQQKTKQNKQAMSRAIADAIPGAISEQMRNSPHEIAKAIAPEMAEAIKEQIELDRSAMEVTLAGVVNSIIIQDIASSDSELTRAIAPIIYNIVENNQLSDVEPKLSKLRRSIAKINQKVVNLEYQIYDPEELKKLLLPWIAELLSMKVTESKAEVVDALAPIVDAVIMQRSQQDKMRMSAAIGELLPDAISQQIRNSPDEVAKALGPEMAAAIKEQIRLEKDAIANVLAPQMGAAIKAQIELERDAMVDALYPVIGNTISKYMVETIRTINDKVTNTLSPEGIRRNIRAKWQGISEAELILKEAMPFTIPAIFLIHKASGLIISDVQHAGDHRLESEMVAGMLTAIRSFVNDCIVQSGEISELNEIEYGDSKIILEVAGYCYLAVVIKGEPPKQFVEKIRQTLSTIILKYGKPIEEFDGDPDKIPQRVREILEALMEISVVKAEKVAKPPIAILGIGVAIASLIFVPWGISQYRNGMEIRIEAVVANAIASTPELALYRLSVDVRGATLKLAGNLPNQQLRSQAEQIAKTTAPTLIVDNKIIAVDVPPDPVLVTSEVKRVTDVLNQMEGISISTGYDKRKVTVEGTATLRADVQKIVQALKQIPGVQSVVSTVEINPLKLATRIYFDAGSVKLNPAYQETIVKIKDFLNRYPQKYLRIVGHSDSIGNPVKNQQLAIQRAEAVRDALVAAAIDPRRLQIVGIAAPPLDVESNQPLLLSRCVTFEPITPGVKSK